MFITQYTTEFFQVINRLNQRYASSLPAGSIEIAFGESISKLYEKETALQHTFSKMEKKYFLYTVTKNALLNEIRRLRRMQSIQCTLEHFVDSQLIVNNFVEIEDR